MKSCNVHAGIILLALSMPYLFICLDVRKESRAHGIKATGNLFWSNIVERKTRLFQLPFSGSPMYHTAKGVSGEKLGEKLEF